MRGGLINISSQKEKSEEKEKLEMLGKRPKASGRVLALGWEGAQGAKFRVESAETAPTQAGLQRREAPERRGTYLSVARLAECLAHDQ